MSKALEKAPLKSPARDPRGRWKPGSTGNPHGSVSTFRRQIRHLVNPNIEPVFERVLAAIGKDERWAIRLFWEEIVPLAHGKAVTPISLSSEDALVQVSTILLDIVPDGQRARIAAELTKLLEGGHIESS